MSWPDSTAEICGIAGEAWSSRRIALGSIGGVWGIYLAFVALRLAMISLPRELLLLERHVLTASVGVGLTWMIYLILRRIEQSTIRVRVVAAALLALPAASFLTLINFELLYVVAPNHIWSERVLQTTTLRGVVARTILEIYLVFAAWAALYTSVTSAVQS